MLNEGDNKQKAVRKQLRIHIQNCKGALDDVDSLLKRYTKMSATDKLAWAWKGHDEMNGLASNLSSFATQLDSFVDGLALRGVTAVYQQQRKLQRGIGRIEEALEKAKGNSVAAVGEVMHEVDQAVDQGTISLGSTQRYKSIISDYAQEVSRSTTFAEPRALTPEPRARTPEPRARTPDPGRGRGDSHGRLSLPLAHKRAASADTSKSDKTLNVKRGRSVDSRVLMDNKPNNRLECWLIQIMSGHLTILTWEVSRKEIQCRGQWKLEEMARQFKSSKSSQLNDGHDFVKWVLKDKNGTERDPDYVWRPYAAKIEDKGILALNLGVEKQAMVIVKRQLTQKVQKKVDEKERFASARREPTQEQQEKGAARRKAKAAAERKTEQLEERQRKAEEDLAENAALIEKLKQENKLLKAQKEKAGEKIAMKKTNNIEASSEGPCHPENTIEANE